MRQQLGGSTMRKVVWLSMVLALVVLAMVGCSETTPKSVTYEVVSTDFVSFDGIWRYTVKARVDNVLTTDELESVSESILRELAETKGVDALAVFFYLRESDIGGAYTAGMAEWVPYGEWARAVDVRSGDHSYNEWEMFPMGKAMPEVTAPDVTPSSGETPNLVLDDNITIRTGNDTATVFGTITNKATYAIADITLTFNLFDATGNQVGTARASRPEAKPIAPGGQWQYQATYSGDDGDKVTKAVRASLTFRASVAPE